MPTSNHHRTTGGITPPVPPSHAATIQSRIPDPQGSPDKTVVASAPRHAASSHAKRQTDPSGKTGKAGKASGAPRQNAPHDEGGRRRRGGKVAAIVAGATVAVLAVAYAAGAAFFSTTYYPNTTIAGVDVSLVNADTAAERLESMTDNYTLTVEGDGFSWSYTPDAATPVFDGASVAERVLADNDVLLWPVHLVQALTGDTTDAVQLSSTVDLTSDIDRSLLAADFDEQTFKDEIGAAVDAFNEGRSGVFDAATAYDPETGVFSAERARQNEKLNRDNITTLALAALANLAEECSIETLGADAFEPLNGSLTDDALDGACEAANNLVNRSITVKLGDNVVSTIDQATLASWVRFDDALTPSLDDGALTTWAQNLADELDTVGSERTYTRPDGKTITVSGGTYGWAVDTEAAVSAIQTAVSDGTTTEVQIPTTSQGVTYTAKGQPDWGAYADIDITEQHARYYDASGNLVWESGVVTGKDSGGNDTPTGIYKVNNKLRNITLVSRNIDPDTGEPEYESPVDYWIAFVGSSIGFHDASWQPSWVYSDPTAYHTRGSHGCINTPLDKVAELYDIIQVGDCVIVHY